MTGPNREEILTDSNGRKIVHIREGNMDDPARKIADVREILEEVRASGAETVEAQLTVLFDKFNTAARAIAPTIRGSWICRDVTLDNKPCSIHFERDGQFGRGGQEI